MGLIFDLLLLAYFGLAVFIGFKRGFLLSVSGIAALIVAVLIYKIFSLDYVYFAIIYILLLVAIALLAKLIRKLKVPFIAKADAILGTALGVFNGFIGVIVISLLMLVVIKATGTKEMDSSFVLKTVRGILQK